MVMTFLSLYPNCFTSYGWDFSIKIVFTISTTSLKHFSDLKIYIHGLFTQALYYTYERALALDIVGLLRVNAPTIYWPKQLSLKANLVPVSSFSKIKLIEQLRLYKQLSIQYNHMNQEDFKRTGVKFNHHNSQTPLKNRVRASVKLPSVKTAHQESGNYILGEVLGEGGFAKVRLCTRKKDGQKLVVKIFQKFKLIAEEKRKAIVREVEIMRCIKHPAIIKLVDYFETSDTINIVMEHFSRTSLTEFVKGQRPLSDVTTRGIVRQVAEGMSYLHKMKIAHRDIKPDNILINQNHEVKIIDLGLSLMGQTETKVAGTPYYMSPELLNKKHYDPFKADVWAFGVLLYWLVLGYFPQDTLSPRKKKNAKSFQLNFPVDIHPGIEYLISKMLHQDPQERVSAEQILVDTWVQPKDLKNEISRLMKNICK